MWRVSATLLLLEIVLGGTGKENWRLFPIDVFREKEMKRLLLLVLLLSTFFANAQITLLHTFEEENVSVCSPTIVEDVGVYYYVIDSTDEGYLHHYPTYYYYDSDFNFYKSFQFETGRYENISLFPTRHLIDTDDELEFIVKESSAISNGYRVHNYIMEEDGTISYDFDNDNGLVASSSFEFVLMNNEIRLLRNVSYSDGVWTHDNFEVYGTGGNYSAEEFHLVTNSVAFPNPARSNITLPYELEDGETATMSIYNLNGQLIERFEIGSHFNQVQLNVNSYSSGIYLYEYKGRSNKFIVR